MEWPIPAHPPAENKSISFTLQSSCHSVCINVASDNCVITCAGDSYFGLADTLQDRRDWRRIKQ
jgi:hypothetical protein